MRQWEVEEKFDTPALNIYTKNHKEISQILFLTSDFQAGKTEDFDSSYN